MTERSWWWMFSWSNGHVSRTRIPDRFYFSNLKKKWSVKDWLTFKIVKFFQTVRFYFDCCVNWRSQFMLFSHHPVMIGQTYTIFHVPKHWTLLICSCQSYWDKALIVLTDETHVLWSEKRCQLFQSSNVCSAKNFINVFLALNILCSNQLNLNGYDMTFSLQKSEDKRHFYWS